MAEGEHFTNGRCFIFGTGSTLMAASFGAQIGGWAHWITVGVGYGSGIILMLLATARITKSYFSRHPEQVVIVPPPNPSDVSQILTSLQIEALEVARDLRELLKDVGPMPHPGWKEPQGDARWEFADARAQKDISDWDCALAARYSNYFADRASKTFRKIAEAGISNPFAEQYAAKLLDGVDKVEQVRTLASALTFMVSEIENKR
jgi:hypothetical protein